MAKIRYCGDDCELCPRYIATKTADREKLKEVAVLWQKTGLTDNLTTCEEMICHGCASLEKCHYNDIRRCAKNRDINNCGECTQYVCDKINVVFEKTAAYALQCKATCSASDYEQLNNAFFLKKGRLDAIHLRYRSSEEQ